MEIVVTNQYGLIIFAVTVDENGMPKTLYQGINRAEAVSTYQKAIENPANAKKRVRFYNFRQVYDYVGAEKDKSAYPIKEFYDDTEVYQPSNKDNIETIMVNNNHKLLGPNGKVSNLTAEQWHLVRTPEFKDWFGDWLRHPNRSSQVLDANGEPMVMFHGSNNYQYFTNPYPNYTVFFDPRMSRLEPRTEGGGVYFSNKWDVAAQFSIFNFVVECFINIRKPIKIDGDYSHIWYVIGEERINYGKNDGVILYNTYDTLDGETKNENYVSDIVIARYSNQVKLADGRNTTFDKNDVDIRFEDGGKLHSSNIDEANKSPKKHDAEILLAPNGKKSNLTPEQWHLVRTPEFKAWFGDWENNPETASKVVDSNGEPLVVWHSSPNYFNIFDAKKSIKGIFHFGTIQQAINRLTYYIETVGFDLSPYIKLTTEQDEEMFEIDIYWKLVNYILLLYFYDKNDVDVYFENIFNSRQKEFIKNIKINIDKNKIKYELDKYNIKPYFLRVIKLGKTNDVGENWELDSSFFDGYMYINLHEGNKKEYSFAVFNPNNIKLADGTNTTFDGSNPDIRYADGGYIRNIEIVDEEDGLMYSGDFGKNGSLTWINNGQVIDVITMGVEDKGSGQGTMAIANLFLLNPKCKIITYQDHSNFEDGSSFWRRIGGSDTELTREDFFKYYESKFGNNPDTSYAEGGKIDYSKDITVVAALTNSNNEVLILQRGATAAWMPLHWSLVGGMVDEGEDKKKAVLREIKEEIGIDVDDVDYVDTIYTKDAGTIVYYVGKLPDDAEIVLDYENVRYDYINSDTINNYDYVPYVKSFIHKLLFEMYRKNHVVKYALYSKITGLPTKNVAPTDFVRSMNNLQSFCVANGLANRIFKGSGGYYVLRHDGTLIKAFDTLNNITYEDAYKLLVRNYEHGGKFYLGSNMSKHLAPNGKPSNLTPEQWHLVRTPAFKAWFGDWENNPQEASKVVDANGEPLIVYRGDASNRYVFNEDTFFSSNDYVAGSYSNEDAVPEYEVFLNIRNPLNLLGGNELRFNPNGSRISGSDPNVVGIFKKAISEMPNDYVVKVGWGDEWDKKTLLNAVIRNHHGIEYIDYNNQSASWEAIIKYAKKEGYDGVFMYDESIDKLIQHQISQIVFHPTQIKLADGSNTTFDGSNPDIRFELGGIYHGSPYRFEKFSTSHIGTGESHRSYGWGLYFTEIEGIAKFYANNVSRPILLDKNANEIKISDELANLIKLGYEKNMMWWDTDYIKEIMGIRAKALGTKWAEDAVKELNQIGYFELVFDRYVYRVTLHKGKTPDQYTWLEWDKPVSAENIIKINKALEKKGIPATPKKYMEVGMDGRVSVGMNGEQVYIELSKIFGDAEFGGDKQASLFLLENGIDGIKYPADKNMAGGFSYVVFDENAVTIENVEHFAKGGKIKIKVHSEEGEEDRTTISIPNVGEVIIAETTPEYEFMDDIDEKTMKELGVEEGDLIGKLEWIVVKDEYKGQGYATLLMKKAIEVAKEKDLMPLYLNASPMGFTGMNTEELTAFYEKFGFKVFKRQGHNNLMILKEQKHEKGGRTTARPYSSLDISRVKKGIVQLHSVHPKRITKIDDLPI